MIVRYSRPEMAALWSDAARFETWLEVELAVCEAMEQAGSVPPGQAALVCSRAAGKLDPARILEIEATTRHDVIAFLTHVEELAGEPARWLHFGMTSSDVLDTALALTCGRALARVRGGIEALQAVLAERASDSGACGQEKTPPRRRVPPLVRGPVTSSQGIQWVVLGENT